MLDATLRTARTSLLDRACLPGSTPAGGQQRTLYSLFRHVILPVMQVLGRITRSLMFSLVALGIIGAMEVPANATTGGASSPAKVVTGFFSEMTRSHVEAACSYLPPGSPRETCLSDATQLPPGTKASGAFHVVRTVVKGSKALVALTGRVCTDVPGGSSQCNVTTNPNSGMPSAKVSFAAAYAAALAGDQNGIGPVPCVKVDGRWYDAASQSS